jgi:membrane peptidoglycan carboxypeptidase
MSGLPEAAHGHLPGEEDAVRRALRPQRCSRLTRPRPWPPRRLLRLVLIAVASAALLQLGVLGLVATAGGLVALRYYNQVTAQGMARLRTAQALDAVPATRILDRHGRLLAEISDTNRGLHATEPLRRIPRAMQEAIVATEDRSFWSNLGFSPTSVVRAALTDLTHRAPVQGASGITQQLVKRLVLTNSDTVQRKLQEVLISTAVARPGSGFSKGTILDLYLNTVFFGHEAYGVQAAARVYFGRDIWQLDLAQCALLAGLVQAPTAYDPLGPDGPAPALRRLRTVLDSMRAVGFITRVQERAARAEAAHFAFQAPGWRLTATRSVAPYWTAWIVHLLGPDSPDPALAAVVSRAGGLSAGLTITTTLDLPLYNRAEQIMNAQVHLLAGFNVHDAAVVMLDPPTAECLAMVGGINFHGTATGSQINMADQPRSPGSSFKLYTYLTAFKEGWSPATMLLDEPMSWPDLGEPGGVYMPMDYDHAWHGAVTVRMALANSLNMPAVRTLAAVGIPNVIKTAEELGVTNLGFRARGAGLSLTLGSVPIPLWQMAQAYNVVAAGGVFRPMASILGIADALGAPLYHYRPPAGRLMLAPQYAYLMTSILSDNAARVPEFGTLTPLRLGNPGDTITAPAAVKTGTSQDFRDNLTIGFTPNLLTATWVGNPDESPMQNVEGVDGAGPIWHDLMEWALQHEHLPVESFAVPPGILLEHVSSSGYLAAAQTAWPITDYFAAGTVPHRFDPGTGDTHLEQRVWTQDFSVDGGALNNAPAGPLPATGPRLQPDPTPPSVTATPLPSLPSGTSGLLSQRPSDPNLCGGRSYTYSAVYINGQLMWRYICQ